MLLHRYLRHKLPVRLRADLRQSRGGETQHTAAKGRKHHHKDIQKLEESHVDAVLIGETMMLASDKKRMLEELKYGKD